MDIRDLLLVSPRNVDTYFNDITPGILKAIGSSDGLGVEYLSSSSRPERYDKHVYGLLYGPYARAMVAMECVVRDECIHVIFLVNTGSASTYFTRQTARALGVPDDIDAAYVEIHGVHLPVHVSPPDANFHNVNMLGTDWMRIARATLSIDFTADSNTAVDIEIHH